mmetsp:Transcript_19361/g.53233  ORF Transcript_19361/g.53233 Transcript_19361/m.53233 type:complete len:262 (-) Transcript_19361:155-940(-)
MEHPRTHFLLPIVSVCANTSNWSVTVALLFAHATFCHHSRARLPYRRVSVLAFWMCVLQPLSCRKGEKRKTKLALELLLPSTCMSVRVVGVCGGWRDDKCVPKGLPGIEIVPSFDVACNQKTLFVAAFVVLMIHVVASGAVYDGQSWVPGQSQRSSKRPVGLNESVLLVLVGIHHDNFQFVQCRSTGSRIKQSSRRVTVFSQPLYGKIRVGAIKSAIARVDAGVEPSCYIVALFHVDRRFPIGSDGECDLVDGPIELGFCR